MKAFRLLLLVLVKINQPKDPACRLADPGIENDDRRKQCLYYKFEKNQRIDSKAKLDYY